MSTYKEMQDAVIAYGFDDTVYRARIKTWLNDGQSEIARSLEIPELFTSTSISVVSGTSTYTKPSDLVRVKGLLDTASGNALDLFDYDGLQVQNMNGQFTGQPQQYAIGTNILLSPVPNANVTLTFMYYKDPPDLSADSDVSLLTPDWHKSMIRYATAEAYLAEDDIQMHAYHFSRYQDAVNRFAADRQFVGDGPIQVPGMWT